MENFHSNSVHVNNFKFKNVYPAAIANAVASNNAC